MGKQETKNPGKTKVDNSNNKIPKRNNYTNFRLYPSESLHIENYASYFHSRRATDLSVYQLNQVLSVHGFFKILKAQKNRKELLCEAVSEIRQLETPQRTTLNDDVSPNNWFHSLTLDVVNTDLDLLQWNNEGVVRSLDSLSFSKPDDMDNNNNNDDVDGQRKERRRKRVSKEKERRVVFDAIHLTKPRTKKCRVKRKCLDDIGVLKDV